MKKLYVYADFDWLKEVELIGELGYERDVSNYPKTDYFHPDIRCMDMDTYETSAASLCEAALNKFIYQS